MAVSIEHSCSQQLNCRAIRSIRRRGSTPRLAIGPVHGMSPYKECRPFRSRFHSQVRHRHMRTNGYRTWFGSLAVCPIRIRMGDAQVGV